MARHKRSARRRRKQAAKARASKNYKDHGPRSVDGAHVSDGQILVDEQGRRTSWEKLGARTPLFAPCECGDGHDCAHERKRSTPTRLTFDDGTLRESSPLSSSSSSSSSSSTSSSSSKSRAKIYNHAEADASSSRSTVAARERAHGRVVGEVASLTADALAEAGVGESARFALFVERVDGSGAQGGVHVARGTVGGGLSSTRRDDLARFVLDDCPAAGSLPSDERRVAAEKFVAECQECLISITGAQRLARSLDGELFSATDVVVAMKKAQAFGESIGVAAINRKVLGGADFSYRKTEPTLTMIDEWARSKYGRATSVKYLFTADFRTSGYVMSGVAPFVLGHELDDSGVFNFVCLQLVRAKSDDRATLEELSRVFEGDVRASSLPFRQSLKERVRLGCDAKALWTILGMEPYGCYICNRNQQQFKMTDDQLKKVNDPKTFLPPGNITTKSRLFPSIGFAPFFDAPHCAHRTAENCLHVIFSTAYGVSRRVGNAVLAAINERAQLQIKVTLSQQGNRTTIECEFAGCFLFFFSHT